MKKKKFWNVEPLIVRLKTHKSDYYEVKRIAGKHVLISVFPL